MMLTAAYFHAFAIAGNVRYRENESDETRRYWQAFAMPYLHAYHIVEGKIHLNNMEHYTQVTAYNLVSALPSSGSFQRINPLRDMTCDFTDIHYFFYGILPGATPTEYDTTPFSLGFIFMDPKDAIVFKLRCQHEIFITEFPSENIIR